MVVVEEEITVATATGPMLCHVHRPAAGGVWPGLILFSEIYQQTEPIRRHARLLAGHGAVVAVPEVYHEHLAAGTVLAYDTDGTALGNQLKRTKPVAAFDSDTAALFDALARRDDCTGHLGAVGVCLGGHLAFRAALHPRCSVAVCFYATDIHTATLGAGGDDSLARAGDIGGELVMVWGRQDPHVPAEGRAAILARLTEAQVTLEWHEVNAAHAFLRDEGPRHDPALALTWHGHTVDTIRRVLCR